MYYDTGGDKPTLILIHGLGSKRQSWAYQMELAKHFRLVVPDLRGHGESTITENITISTFAQDTINLLHKLNIHKAHFVGLSLGGIVVQEILRQKPNIVESVILSNTASIIPYTLGSMVVNERQRKLQIMTDKEYIREVAKGCLYDKHNEKLIDEMIVNFFKLNRNTYLEAAKAPLGVNYTSTLMFNAKPTLIMGSLNDNVTPYINTLIMKMFSPFAKLKTFNFCGHASNVEKADEFNESVMEFLKEHVR